MPEIRPSSGDFGETVPEIFGASIPIRANCADQGAALFGECCFSVGDAKVTAGTGCFLDVNTGTGTHHDTHTPHTPHTHTQHDTTRHARQTHMALSAY